MRKSNYLDTIASLGIESAHPGGFDLTKSLLSRERITPGMRVLDAGCGTGKTAAYLAKQYNCDVTAVDLHPTMLKQAIQRFSSNRLPVKVVQANIERLPFLNQSFDLVLSESVVAFSRIPSTLREFSRVLKPGGVLLSIDVTAKKPLSREQIQEVTSFYGFTQVPTKERWLRLLQDAGFRQVKVLREGTIPVMPSLFQKNPQNALSNHYELLTRYKRSLGFGCYRSQL